MCIGEDNVFWTGTTSELNDSLITSYVYRKFDDDIYPVKRNPSDLGFDYIKRNKQ